VCRISIIEEYYTKMKQKLFTLFATLLCSISMFADGAPLSGKFTINEYGNQIVFSQGNLQYRQSDDTYRFAPTQYEILGNQNYTALETIDDGDKTSLYIDLFGWGTGKAPTFHSEEGTDYDEFYDWGNNPITNGGNAASPWRTLTWLEWGYLFLYRTNAEERFAFGTVNGVKGLIILPDEWQTPQGLTFKPSTTMGLEYKDVYFAYMNTNNNNFSHNTYNGTDWDSMEQAGAVFLPAAGSREGTRVSSSGQKGYYWSSDYEDENRGQRIFFDEGSFICNYYIGESRSKGMAVRLVQEVPRLEVYTEFVEETGTLTYYYDMKRLERTGVTERYDPNVYKGKRFDDYNKKIKKAVIDPSMKDAPLTSMAEMFYCGKSLSAMTTIEGLENLNTSIVTDMGRMFYCCTALTSLDLSSFNTENVTNMMEIFSFCDALTSLDLSSFNTENVTNMGGMFYSCDALTSLDLSSFNTENVTSMGAMFSYCDALTSLDLSSFNTENVTSMGYMFSYCTALTSLDLSSFNTENVTNMNRMFYQCSKLTTIYCDQTWTCTESEDMFKNCKSLKGVIAYDENKVDVTYANSETGYFTPGQPYAALSNDNKTLTFYYDYDKESRSGMNIGPFDNIGDRGWNAQSKNITTVVFDDSFAGYTKLTSTNSWFSGCSALTTITGINNLKTDNVTDMMFMFFGCSKLTSLDLTGLNTGKVTKMDYMFCNCSALATIICDDTWNCDNSEYMFSGCKSLKGAIAYDENKVDVTYANPETGYFTHSPYPYAVLSNDNKTLTFYYDVQKESRNGMDIGPFDNLGDRGWNAQSKNITTVVFDDSFAGYTKLTSTHFWFSGCSALTTITGINNLKTDNVTDMMFMFFGCSKLTSLDLTGFNTAKVTKMDYMFCNCSALATIICDDTWNCDNSEYMFYECTSLKGAIAYDENKVDVTYANPETGYFIERHPYAVLSDDNKTLTFYYDVQKESRNGMDIGPFKNDYERGWDAQRKNITTVVFDKSFADCKEVTSTAHWFRDFSSLSTIVGIENLITKNVTTMIGMFRGCSSLESIDVSHFNTANVTTMRFLFFGCSSLKRLDVRAFNTAQVTDMNGMFRGCSSLTVLDLCNLNTTQVTDMGYMFYGSSDLTTIYGNDAWTCSNSDKMFTDCTSLKGAIAYDAAKTDVSMANPTTGYFTKELPVLKGDANHDGKVDETDIQPIVDYIMTGKTDGFYFDNANLNGDTKVDAADLVLLINQVNNP